MKRPHGFDGGANEPQPKVVLPPAKIKNDQHVAPVHESSVTSADVHPSEASGTETETAAQPGTVHAPVELRSSENQSLQLNPASPKDQLTATSLRARQALRELKRAQRERRSREKGERKRFTQLTRTRRRRWFVGLGAVLVLAVFVTVGIFSPALNLQKITVVGAQRLDPAAVSASLSGQLGKPLALVDQQSIQDSLGAFNLIQEYTIEILPPHELIVRIVERKPVLNLKRGESFDLVDPAGVVIQSAAERIAGYPMGDGLVVDVNSAAFTATAQSLAYMQGELAAQVETAAATTDQDVTFTLASGLTIIWGSSEHSVRKSVLVNKMLTALAGRPISVINVSSTEAPVFS